MERLDVSVAVRLIYRSLGVKGLNWKTVLSDTEAALGLRGA